MHFPKAEELTLYAPPSEAWTMRWDEVARLPYLATRLDRTMRIMENSHRLQRWAPELITGSGVVYDIGPGMGERMEVARFLGHATFGVDAPDGYCRKTRAAATAARLHHLRQKLIVEYNGVEAMGQPAGVQHRGRCVMVTAWRSLEWLLYEHAEGSTSSLFSGVGLRWRISLPLEEQLTRLFDRVAMMLRPGGVFIVSLLPADNVRDMEAMLRRVARQRLGDPVAVGESTFKWRKGDF